MPTNPYTVAQIAPQTAAYTSAPLALPTVFDTSGEHMRVTLSLTWIGDKPADVPENTVQVRRITSQGDENTIATLTPSRPRLRDMPPDVYVLQKFVSTVPIGVDASGFSAATTVSE